MVMVEEELGWGITFVSVTSWPEIVHVELPVPLTYVTLSMDVMGLLKFIWAEKYVIYHVIGMGRKLLAALDTNPVGSVPLVVTTNGMFWTVVFATCGTDAVYVVTMRTSVIVFPATVPVPVVHINVTVFIQNEMFVMFPLLESGTTVV
jgi:hypothetical protein